MGRVLGGEWMVAFGGFGHRIAESFDHKGTKAQRHEDTKVTKVGCWVVSEWSRLGIWPQRHREVANNPSFSTSTGGTVSHKSH